MGDVHATTETEYDRAVAAVGFFKSKKIPVHTAGETEYERSVATANLIHRFTRPACVVQPEDKLHVQTVIRRAKLKDIPIRIKNGGHSYAGFSSIQDGILVDLVNMKKVELDIESGIVTLQGGAQWGHAYKELVNEHHDGFVINGGRCPTVGVSGFILGGGLGPFTRSFGMGCDTLQEATLVTADGNVVTVRESDYLERPQSREGKLFWALCGAGGGNFGVLVELKMRVQKLRGKDVVAGRFTWSQPEKKPDDKAEKKPDDKAEKTEEKPKDEPAPKPEDPNHFMETMQTFYTAEWPDELTIDSSWLCDLSQAKTEPAVRFLVYYDGKKDTFEELIEAKLGKAGVGDKAGDLAKQLKRRSLEEKSTRFLHETLVAQWSEETIKAFPSNPSYSIYTSFVFKNDKDQIKAITGIIRDEMKGFREYFEGEQALLQVTWIHSGGQASRREDSATAVSWRACDYHTYILINWQEKFLERDMRGFLEKMNEKLRKYSMREMGAFVNFPDESLKEDAHEKAYWGDNHEELRRVKALWDPEDFFRWKQSVRLPEKPAEVARRGMAVFSSRSAVREEVKVEEDTIVVANAEFLKGRALTDKIAGKEWDRFDPAPRNEFVGGIQGLTDLGF